MWAAGATVATTCRQSSDRPPPWGAFGWAADCRRYETQRVKWRAGNVPNVLRHARAMKSEVWNSAEAWHAADLQRRTMASL